MLQTLLYGYMRSCDAMLKVLAADVEDCNGMGSDASEKHC